MANRLESYDDHDMEEILRRAIRKDATHTSQLRERLIAAANELGISPDAVLAAEDEYRLESARAKQLALYDADRKKALRIHLITYVSVNLFLFVLNLMTWREDHMLWAIIPLLGWGIGMLVHAATALSRVDWNSGEFQMWRRMRLDEDDQAVQ